MIISYRSNSQIGDLQLSERNDDILQPRSNILILQIIANFLIYCFRNAEVSDAEINLLLCKYNTESYFKYLNIYASKLCHRVLCLNLLI